MINPIFYHHIGLIIRVLARKKRRGVVGMAWVVRVYWQIRERKKESEEKKKEKVRKRK